jgi:hypothetical protein
MTQNDCALFCVFMAALLSISVPQRSLAGERDLMSPASGEVGTDPANRMDGASTTSLSPDQRLEELFATFQEEPSAQLVQVWAVQLARAEPSRAASLLRDARSRGGLPLIRLRGRYEDGNETKWDELDLIDSRDRDSKYSLDLWLEWDLAELASGPDALRAVREGRALAALRQGVINQVNIAYFDRRRLLAEAALARDDESRAQSVLRRLRIEELIATLDGLTGGLWTSAQSEALAPVPPPQSCDEVASEQCNESQGENPDSGLRVPVHPVDRSASP